MRSVAEVWRSSRRCCSSLAPSRVAPGGRGGHGAVKRAPVTASREFKALCPGLTALGPCVSASSPPAHTGPLNFSGCTPFWRPQRRQRGSGSTRLRVSHTVANACGPNFRDCHKRRTFFRPFGGDKRRFLPASGAPKNAATGSQMGSLKGFAATFRIPSNSNRFGIMNIVQIRDV